MRARFLVLPACFVIMAAAGFYGSSLTNPTVVHVPQINLNNNKCVSSAVQADAVPTRLLTDNTNALWLVGFASTAVPVCILAADPSKKQRRIFRECMAEKECDNWRKYEDESDGTVAMICQD